MIVEARSPRASITSKRSCLLRSFSVLVPKSSRIRSAGFVSEPREPDRGGSRLSRHLESASLRQLRTLVRLQEPDFHGPGIRRGRTHGHCGRIAIPTSASDPARGCWSRAGTDHLWHRVTPDDFSRHARGAKGAWEITAQPARVLAVAQDCRDEEGRSAYMSSSFLHRLLGAEDPPTFLGDVYGKTFRHLTPAQGGYTDLVTWKILDRLLSTHRLGPPRLRLSLEGRQLPPASYLAFQSDSRGTPYSRVDPEGLAAALSDGATLVLDAIDEMHAPIAEAAYSLGEKFGGRVGANLYAGWSDRAGFGPHFDNHDVFIVQVIGQKDWALLGQGPAAAGEDRAPDQVAWSGRLVEGEALYIPRGWWHEARMTGAPSVHLTFSMCAGVEKGPRIGVIGAEKGPLIPTV